MRTALISLMAMLVVSLLAAQDDGRPTKDPEFERRKKETERVQADLQKRLASSRIFVPGKPYIETLKSDEGPRKTTSLNGEWKFRRDEQKEWKTVTLPTHWETHEGLKFDGIGWYEKTLPAITLPPGRRLLLHFDAVATHATVYWNDVKLGDHLGAWTPFRFDVTEHVKKPGPHTIRIRVDEKVGHNTQGFLPIIAPHFGGIWQGVKLVETSSSHIDDSTLNVVFDPTKKTLRVVAKRSGEEPSIDNIEVSWRQHGQEKWKKVLLEWMAGGSIITERESPAQPEEIVERFRLKEQLKWPEGQVRTEARNRFSRQLPGGWKAEELSVLLELPDVQMWSPHSPVFYDLRIATKDMGNSKCYELVQTTFAPRTIETKGDQFLLNGQPLSIRGVLNWGYYPPSLAPTPSDEQWRSDLRLIKSWGFNLMKCCLWVPPKRLLEIADEEGVLIWLEYPTWHPKLTPQYRDELLREYREFHQLDRNHPSVILRSLTCETGPGADLQVIQALYDQCKKMCGGLVVDDSSWIEWNRVCDFYDDHPYGNNHTWVAKLTRLKDYIAKSKLGVKPLCLGEAIAADTWVPTKPMLEAIARAKADPKQAWSLDERGYPYWVPGFFDANQKWLERMGKVCGYNINENDLLRESRSYSKRMRRFQMEVFRREVPNGGYVVSVLRDFPLASMGLIDYHGKPKWEKPDWLWQNDPAILIHRQDDLVGNHSLAAGTVEIISDQPRKGTLTLDFFRTDYSYQKVTHPFSILRSGQRQSFSYAYRGSAGSLIESGFGVYARLDGSEEFVEAHPLFIPAPATDLPPAFWYGMDPLPGSTLTARRVKDLPTPGQAVVLTNKMSVTIIEFLEGGGHVLVLPDGSTNSFPLRDHWFLRGGPFVNERYADSKSGNFLQFMPRLQQFDLAGKVIPEVEYLEEIDPICMLWDNHDIKTVKTHGLVFSTQFGRGRLVVSALNHSGAKNVAGHYTLGELIRIASDRKYKPRNALKPETITRLRAKLNEKKLDLTRPHWQFQPDGKNEGLTLGWHKPDFDDTPWKPIRIGRAWEGEGHATLDGWAWYRLKVEVPKDWPAQGLYLNTEGVDDAYEIYVNGTKIGAGGDIPNKQTAFEERKSHAIPAGLLKPGAANVIAIRVDDWYGAGGVHRPVTLSNVPFGGADLLK